MSLLERQIQCTITLASDSGQSFSGQNTVTLDGLQVSATITKFGQPQLDTAEIRIWGMLLSDMNAVSRLGKPLTWPRDNTITVKAGDTTTGMAQVFSGTINTAYVDFSAQPDAVLNITAISNLVAATKPIPPTSFPGVTTIGTIMQQLASTQGTGFINSGVTAVLKNQYLTGSAVDQARKAAEAANCNWTPNGGNDGNQWEIWPKNTARGAMGPLFSPETGLVGYPSYVDRGVMIRVLYRPGIEFGQAFTLKSSLKLDIETWYIYSMVLDLVANDPSGENPWFVEIGATTNPIT